MNLIAAREELRKVSVQRLEHAGCYARLRAARRIRGEGVHALPSGIPIQAVPIACLPGAPEGWVREAGTYIIEVDTEHGLWFDWQENDHFNTAIIPSVKGMNPITGKKLESVRLEQYHDKCPWHDVALSHERFCSACGYKLPPQNYVSYPNPLWWDGLRQPDGTVRQFFFSEDEKRDIASAVIGKENTVPAFGFGFFRPKVQRLQARLGSRYHYNSHLYAFNHLASMDGCKGLVGNTGVEGKTGGEGNTGSVGHKGVEGPAGSWGALDGEQYKSTKISCASTSVKGAFTYTSTGSTQMAQTYPGNAVYRGMQVYEVGARDNKLFAKEGAEERKTKDVSVGGGAIIDQDLKPDTLTVDDWKQEPHAIIRLYFVFSEQMSTILERGGVVRVEGSAEGYLAGLPVG